MNLEKLNPWLTLLSNVAVVAGIIFLAMEIQQNSETIRISNETEQRRNVLGRYVEVESLAEIEALIGETTGFTPIEIRLIEDYGLSPEQAKRWWRFMLDQWISNAVNWEYSNDDSVCTIGANLLRINDNHVLFEEFTPFISASYIQCVNDASGRLFQ